MRGMFVVAFSAALALSLSCGAGADENKCQLVRFAALPLTVNAAGQVTVPVPINGQPLNMLVDTGAFVSVLNRDTVTRLHMAVKITPGAWIIGFGGASTNHVAIAHEVTIAGIALKDRPFYVVDATSDLFDGVLGEEMLQVFDLDFDFAGGKLGFFSQRHCPGKVVYWTNDPYAVLEFEMEGNHIVFDVDLGGRTVKAMLDTGASQTVMSLETASGILGIDEDKLQVLRDKGEGRSLFKTLTVQGITVNDPNIRLYSNDDSRIMGGSGNIKLILGMGVLRQLHFFVAYQERKIYITPAGAHK
jgi:predicted aspartyl protease